jgi:NTP pyrophosphatase (non-canonical NTP hydrolase)
MKLSAFQKLSQRTMNPEQKHSEALTNFAMGLAGEAGETVDIVKKHVFHGHELDKAKASKEIGDVLYYAAALATTLDLDLDVIALENVEKLRKRYPNGFNSADSILRRDTKD